jgi:hypothetical protein
MEFSRFFSKALGMGMGLRHSLYLDSGVHGFVLPLFMSIYGLSI